MNGPEVKLSLREFLSGGQFGNIFSRPYGKIENVRGMTNYNVESHAHLPGIWINANDIEMNWERLSKLSKSRLIDILLERNSAKSHDGLSVKSKVVIPAKFNPKSLT